MAGFQGNGTTVAIAGGPAGLFDEIVGMSLGGVSREMLSDTDFSTTGAMTFFAATNYDMGTLSVTVKPDMSIDPDTIMATGGNVTIVFSDAGAAQWVIAGLISGYNIELPIAERVEATVDIKLSGGTTVT